MRGRRHEAIDVMQLIGQSGIDLPHGLDEQGRVRIA